jgi:Thermopsin
MADRRLVLLGAALVTAVMIVSSMGLLASYERSPSPAGVAAATPVGASAPRTPTTGSSSPFGLPAIPASTTPHVPATSTAQGATEPFGIAEVQQEIASGQVDRSAALLPRAPSGPIPAAGSPITGPSYPGLPAPMGLSDLGQSASGPYEYNSSSFAASLELNSFQDYNPGYSAWGASPNWMTFQLNTVTVNVSYPGATNGSFWIQNVVHFNGTTLQFEDNIWNFSSPLACLEPGTLLNYSGTQDGCFYYVYGPTFTVSYPLSLTLYNNVTISNWGPFPVPDVFFNYSLTDASGTFTGSFDNVTFNGLASPAAPPMFEVNGFNYSPIGYLFWDAEIILGGNGGGANAVLQELNATVNLLSWDATTDSYTNVSAAYDYGEDTGETSVGVAATYTGATETLVQGPSLLYGLWNTSANLWGPAASPGAINLTVTGMPSTGFAFVANQTSWSASGLNDSYWPAAPDGTLTTQLPPPALGNGYQLDAFANGFQELTPTSPLTTSGTTPITMVADSSIFNSPVYLSTDAQAAAFGSYGLAGVTYQAGGLSITDTESTIAPAFNLVNDFWYPTFVLFAALNLSVNVSIDQFTMADSSFVYHGIDGRGTVPGWSQGYYFNFGSGTFDVANVSITGNSSLYWLDGVEPLASVEFWSVNGENASYIASSQDNFGVDAWNSNDASFFQVAADTGANAVFDSGGEGFTAVDISANGTDYPGPIYGYPSYGVILEDVEGAYVDGLQATNDGLGLYAAEVAFFDFTDIQASDADQVISPLSPYAAPTVYLYDVGAGDISNVVANDAVGIEGAYYGNIGFYDMAFTNGAFAGELAQSSSTVYWGLNVTDSSGLELYEANDFEVGFVNVSGSYAPGQPAWGVEMQDSEFVFLTNLTVADGAEGALVETGQNVTVTNVTAETDAFGFGALGVQNITIENLTVVADSVGALAEGSDNVTVEGGTVVGVGTDVGIAEDDNVTVENLNATSATPGPQYFAIAMFSGVPNTPVSSYYNQGVDLSNISSYNAGFGLYDNGSLVLNAAYVTSFYASVGIVLNGTVFATVAYAFLFGSETGALLNDTLSSGLFASTIEDSVGFGVSVILGYDVYVSANNFVANNGASTDGIVSASHLQASSVLGINVWFNESGIGNYWSDWVAASGAYVIAVGVEDVNPQAAFISTWLEFNETGLPAGTEWGFTLDSVVYRTSAPLVFIPSWSLGDPTLSYVVIAPVGYSPTPPSGTLSYVGVNATVTITFSAIPYTATFVESGLPVGTTWSVTFNGVAKSNTTIASGGTIVFSVIVGSYSYSVGVVQNYSRTPSGGPILISGDQVVDVTFKLVTYTVTFTESGLPAGTSWSVSIGSQTVTSSSDSLAFALSNGTYPYTVNPVSGYTISPATGSVVVTPTVAPMAITFSATPVATFSVTFSESGLPSGTTWSVTLGGATKSASAGSTIEFTGLTNGTTYAYTIGGVTGYTSSPSSSSITLDGKNATVAVTFSSSTPTSSSGLSPLEYGIIGLVIVLIIVGVAIALARRGRGGTSTSPPQSGGGAPPDGSGGAESPPPTGPSEDTP